MDINKKHPVACSCVKCVQARRKAFGKPILFTRFDTKWGKR